MCPPVGVEVPSFEQLQRHERHAVHFADVVDLHDVRVPELGDGLGLDPEAGQVISRTWLPPMIILRATARFRPVCRAL